VRFRHAAWRRPELVRRPSPPNRPSLKVLSFLKHRRERGLNRLVPASRRKGAVMKTPDIKAVARARHRHVKKPPLLALLASLYLVLGLGDGPQAAGAFDSPNRNLGRFRIIVQKEKRGRRGALSAARIGQDDDIGFEALGAVYGHDADLARCLVR